MVKIKKRGIFVGIVSLAVIFCFGLWCGSESESIVKGAIYEGDGTTPVEGAVVRLENVTSGDIYESTITGSEGSFVIERMQTGVYFYGINSSSGSYDSDGLIGVRIDNEEPARMTIALNRYTKREEIEIKMANQNPGEHLIGEIVECSPENRLAEVKVIRGVLKQKDRIHVVGEETDFYQNLDSLNSNGIVTPRLFVNQSGLFKTKKETRPGDLVYLAQDKGGFWTFLGGPAGIATVIASTATIGHVAKDLSSEQDVKEASPFR
jgi:hypothetical protein